MNSRKKIPARTSSNRPVVPGYDSILAGMVALLESARRASARSVNSLMTATYWEMGRRLVEVEQGGKDRAAYGEGLIRQLAVDLTQRFHRGFSTTNLKQFRKFYLLFHGATKGQTLSDLSVSPARIGQTVSDQSEIRQILAVPEEILSRTFALPWSHYVQLLKVEKAEARQFYESETLRCGWTVRQLDRQISTLFYERTLASRNKTAMLRKGAIAKSDELLTPEEEIKDPLVLEFLGLKDEYSENDLEEALIHQLEAFLLELGSDFAFVGRQKRLRIGDEWYRVDLVFFHRKLRCLIIIDLKLGKFTHADAGQMHLYVNYAREHWTNVGENPPVGLILCTQKDHAVVRYALEALPNKVLAAEYRTSLPDEATLAAELERRRRLLESRSHRKPKTDEK